MYVTNTKDTLTKRTNEQCRQVAVTVSVGNLRKLVYVSEFDLSVFDRVTIDTRRMLHGRVLDASLCTQYDLIHGHTSAGIYTHVYKSMSKWRMVNSTTEDPTINVVCIFPTLKLLK